MRIEGKAFRPRWPIVGLISSGVTVGGMSAIIIAVARHQPSANMVIKWLPLALIIAFDAAALFFGLILFTMKYFVSESQVILRCGPFRWKIPAADIRSIVEKDVGYMPVSEGWKLPGYALFNIDTADVGPVRMCSTSLTKRILLIETGKDLWGITPADVDGFVAALNMKLDR